MSKSSIAIYLQHYLSPSMTFVYRQLKSAEEKYQPIVLCSDWLENQNIFPYEKLYFKQRNFIRIKKSRVVSKLLGWHTLLSSNPKLSKQQAEYFHNILKENDVKLIHAHFGPAGLEIAELAKKIGIPLIVTFHGYDASILLRIESYVQNLKKLFEYAHIVAISNSMKEELVKLGADASRINVIRCGIPTDRFQFVERESLKNKFEKKDPITFLQVSNFVEVKGHKYTVLAFKNFNNRYRNSKLILAGGGPTKNEIVELCHQLKISDKVEFPGIVKENQVFELMKNADVFLHHSVKLKTGVKEGLPTVIMEAMSTGLPVISTFHSAIPELINPGYNGYLVNEKDIDGYTKTLFELKNSSSGLSNNARKTVLNDFDLSIETDKLFRLYDDAMKLL